MKIKILMFLSMASFNTFAVTDPSELKIKVYQVSVSLSSDCTSPVTILTSATGVETDFMASPTLGSGTLADGTYNCVMITMEDVIKFKPLANDGAVCTAGTEYSIDLCRNQASSGGNALYSFTDLLLGTTFTSTECQGTSQIVASGGISNKVTLFLRTTAPSSASIDADDVTSWKKGTVAALSQNGGTGPSVVTDNGIQLSSPFVVLGSRIGIFYVDARGQVTGAGANCEMNAPEFGFRTP